MTRHADRSFLFAMSLLVAVSFAFSPALANAAPIAAPAASASTALADTLSPVEVAADSPRTSMTRFLEATGGGRYQDAALYIDLQGKEVARGAEIARRLDAVLKRRLWLEPEQLSPFAKGAKDAAIASPVELGRIRDRKDHTHPVRLIRKEPPTKDDEGRWVFGHETVAYVDEWYDLLEDRWVRERIPEPLLREGPQELMWWQWLAIPLFGAVAWALGRLLSLGTRALLTRFVSRNTTAWDKKFVGDVGGPLTLAWGVALLFLGKSRLALYEPADDFASRVLRAILFIALFWALARAVRAFAEATKEAGWGKNRPAISTLAGMGVRAGRLVLIALGIIAVLSELGYPVGSLLTGLGVGGIAVALAAQKTMEHLFGSISILIDQPFRVGETIKVDGITGTVEQIGLRSTKLRTEDRTIITIPNGKLADMRIENLAPRDRIRFLCEFDLAATIGEPVLKDLLAVLATSVGRVDGVLPSTAEAHAKTIQDGAVRIELSAFVSAADVNAVPRLRDAIVAATLAVFAARKVQLVSRTVIVGPSAAAAAA